MTIQNVSEEKKILQLLAAVSEEFLQSVGSQLDYQKITDTILDISGAKYAAFDLYEEDGSKFRTVALSGPRWLIKAVSSLLGFKLLGKVWDNDSVRAKKIKSYTTIHFSTLSEYAEDLVNKPVALLIEKAINEGELAFVKILKDNIMVGNFTLVMPKNIGLKNENYVELYTRQVGLLITRSRAEAKLRESEIQLKSILSAMSDPLFLIDQKTGAILETNSAACRLYGYTRDEILALKASDMSAEPDKTNKAIKGSLNLIPVRHHKKKDGTVFIVEITSSLFELNGRSVLATSMRDITERKKADEELREKEIMLSKVQQIAHLGYFKYNPVTSVVEGSEELFGIFGLMKEEFQFSSFVNSVHPDDRPFVTGTIKSAVDKNSSYDIEHRLLIRNGTIKWVRAIGEFASTTPKEQSLLVGTVQDITKRKKAEKVLQESEEKYRTLVEKTDEAITILQNGLFIFANHKTCKLVGKQEGELEGKPFVDFVWPEDKKKVVSNHKRRMTGEVLSNNFEFRIIGADGSPVWLSVSITEIQYNGKPATLNLATDITMHKQLEEVLLESKKTAESYLNIAAEIIVSLDAKGNITLLNDSGCRLLGYNHNELIGKNWFKTCLPDEVASTVADSFKILMSGEVESFAVFENPVKTKNGKIRTILWHNTILKDLIGNITGSLSSGLDITERKLAEETLRVERERFANIIEGTNAGTWEWDVKTGEIMINKRLAELIGYTLDELSGVNVDIWDKLYHPGDLKKADDLMNKCFAKEIEHYICESRMKHKNGNWVWMKENGKVTSWTSDGKPLFVSGTHIDITELKQTEEEILHLSFHDHLTGLYNRRFFEEELKRLDTQRQLPLSFIMGDLNSLKIINDVFGHTAGDELLKETSEILKKVCRSDDILARWGGDEFVILLPKTSTADTEEIVQRIKNECRKTDCQKIPLSLSIGAATKETSGQDIQTIVIDAESNMYKNKLAQKDSLASSIIFALEQALYEKSYETKEHTDRMHELALKLGKSAKLSSNQLDELSLLVSLHDIGKVAIPETILAKEGKLTKREWGIIKRHPEIGFNIAQSSPQISHIAKSILSCHENFDGSGYPRGLKGEEIPLISRIILIVDTYDVMTCGRVYNPALSKEDVIAELKRCAGIQFDPALIDKAIEILIK